jgi:tetratricopeptide (TPR) repeat protein
MTNVTAQTTSPPSGARGLVLDKSTLQRRSLELLARVDADPRAAAERMAAAEAHLRLVVTGASRDQAIKLLERAFTLDPYRAEIALAYAIELQRAGSIASALEHFDHAALLAPNDARVRFHRGYALLVAMRASGSGDFAEDAQADFEAALAARPALIAAALGAIEAALYGKTKPLRDGLARLFARVAPIEEHRAAIARLLYQAIFAFGVGKAKNVDKSNEKTMAEIADVARAWLVVFPNDRALSGVVAAAQAKRDTAEQICDKVAEYARAIPDVRVLRLLLRERLADVAEPARRLELFESAMTKIPPLDGIAQDYLQLVHLVAKRAVALGDLDGARAAWQSCLARDADNPSTVHNLLRLAEHQGDAKAAAPLRAKLAELWSIYTRYSPRADITYARISAEVAVGVQRDLDAMRDKHRKNEGAPSVDGVEDLLHRMVRAHALARVGADESARAATKADVLRKLVALETPAADLFDDSLRVLATSLSDQPATAYAYFAVPKDVPGDVLEKAIQDCRERWERQQQEMSAINEPTAQIASLVERAQNESRAFVDPQRRAAYDGATASIELTEMCRAHHAAVLELVALSGVIGDDKLDGRIRLAGKLWKLRTDMFRAYVPTSESDEGWFKRGCGRAAYAGLVKRAHELYKMAKPEEAVEVIRPYLDPAGSLFEVQGLYAMCVLEDLRKPIKDAVTLAAKHAKLGIECFHWMDAVALRERLKRMTDFPESDVAQEGAAERALNCLGRSESARALRELAAAFPGTAKIASARSGDSSAEMWSGVQPAGRGQYAWVVARAIRANTIEWYNAMNPTTQYELSSIKGRALRTALSSERWATYAKNKIETDPLPRDYIAGVNAAIADLMQALQTDRRMLGG